MDFTEPCPFVRPGLPLFGFCSSGRSFASALLSDGASRRPPLRLASPLSHRTWAEDFHLPAVKHARHTRGYGHHRTMSTAAWKSRTEREIPTFPQPTLCFFEKKKRTHEKRRQRSIVRSTGRRRVASSTTCDIGKNNCRQPAQGVDVDHTDTLPY